MAFELDFEGALQRAKLGDDLAKDALLLYTATQLMAGSIPLRHFAGRGSPPVSHGVMVGDAYAAARELLEKVGVLADTPF